MRLPFVYMLNDLVPCVIQMPSYKLWKSRCFEWDHQAGGHAYKSPSLRHATLGGIKTYGLLILAMLIVRLLRQPGSSATP